MIILNRFRPKSFFRKIFDFLVIFTILGPENRFFEFLGGRDFEKKFHSFQKDCIVVILRYNTIL